MRRCVAHKGPSGAFVTYCNISCFFPFDVWGKLLVLIRPVLEYFWGGRVVRWCWVNFQCRGVLLIWIRVGQGPTALAVGVGGGCLDIFSLVCHFSLTFSLSLGDGPIWTEILSQRAVKPKTTNQPTSLNTLMSILFCLRPVNTRCR